MKVLIVDDNSDNLYLLELILKARGYVTVSAKNGAEALRLARIDTPDLIITDILMPVMDGFTLCREFKKDENLCNVPFIFYTATYTDPMDEEFALSLGADKFILKPQEPEEFTEIVEAVLKEVKGKNTKPTEIDSTPEIVILKEYNEALVRKLEYKILKLEQSEKEIQKYNNLLLEEIEEHKRTEDKLQKSEERFRIIAENLTDVIYSWDVKETIDWYGDIDGVAGYPPGGYPRKIEGWIATVHPEDRDRITAALQDHVKGLAAYAVEYRVKRGDGEWRWWSARGTAIRNEQGEAYRMIGSVTDITLQKQMVEELLKLSRAVEQSPASIIITDIQGNIEYVNPKVIETTGYELSELLGRNPRIFRSGEKSAYDYKVLWNTISSGEEWRGELHNKKKNGELFWESASISAIKNTKGELTHYLAVKEDITERKRAEEALRESEERYRAVSHSASDAIITTDSEGIIIDWNKGAEKIFGFLKTEITGKKLDTIIPKDDLAEHIKNRESSVRGIGESVVGKTVVLQGLHKDGKQFPMELSLAEWEIPSGKFFTGIIRDITEKQLSTELLLKSENEFRTLAESMPQIVWITRADGWNIYFNQQWVDYTGMTLEESYGNGWNLPFHPDDRQQAWDAWQDAIINSGIYSIESRLRNADGVYNWFLIRGVPMMNAQGIILKWFGTCTDINEIKYAEQEMILAKEKAEEINRLKSNFLSNMSHELRTPLIGILGYADLLRQDAESEENREMADTIFNSGTRLSETLNLILDLSRFETENKDIKYQKIDLVSEAKEVITLFEAIADKKGISLRSLFSQDSIIINFDERAFHSIINNLINNAIKFTIEGSITTTISLNDDYVEIKVVDTGIGIAEQNYQNIFEEFRQVSEGYSRNFEGSGLGLSITKKLVEKFGGTISVESEIGKGSAFKVILPVANALENLEEPAASEIPSTKKSQKLKSEKPLALVVDDDPLVFPVIKRYTSEYLELDSTIDAELAFKKLKKEHYDLIFMDINLRQGMDGKEATKIIRTMKGYENIPIIATTAYAMRGDREEFLEAGCSHYLSKPFSRKELEGLLEKVLK